MPDFTWLTRSVLPASRTSRLASLSYTTRLRPEMLSF